MERRTARRRLECILHAIKGSRFARVRDVLVTGGVLERDDGAGRSGKEWENLRNRESGREHALT
jgi:hypothetical protein